jgi:hypothetical protein
MHLYKNIMAKPIEKVWYFQRKEKTIQHNLHITERP